MKKKEAGNGPFLKKIFNIKARDLCIANENVSVLKLDGCTKGGLVACTFAFYLDETGLNKTEVYTVEKERKLTQRGRNWAFKNMQREGKHFGHHYGP